VDIFIDSFAFFVKIQCCFVILKSIIRQLDLLFVICHTDVVLLWRSIFTKANRSRRNLPHGTDSRWGKETKNMWKRATKTDTDSGSSGDRYFTLLHCHSRNYILLSNEWWLSERNINWKFCSAVICPLLCYYYRLGLSAWLWYPWKHGYACR